MGDLIHFAESPLTVTDADKTWVMTNPPSFDVARYEVLDLQILVLSFKPTSGGIDFRVVIETSMFSDQEASWVQLGSFGPVTEAPSTAKLNLSGLLRYIRWRVTKLDGAEMATFILSGMVRAGL